jgi:hypothetical protein
MDADTVARLNVTVEAFVERCLSTSRKPPFAELADCLQELRALEYWSEDEIELIRGTATRLINERISGPR